MEENSYNIYINLKIPLLTRIFYYLFLLCLIIIVLCGIYLLPSDYASNEMRATYFFLTTSNYEAEFFLIGILGTPFFYVLYKYIRINQQGLLTLFPDKIELDNYKTNTTYQISEITDIACNDSQERDGTSKGKLTIDFKDKSNKVISMTLIDYSKTEQLMNVLLNYENIKFELTNFSNNPQVLDM